MSAGYYLQVFFSLFLLLGLLIGLKILAARLKTKRYIGDMKVVDRMPVENGVSLIIVEIRAKQYLMGLSSKGINLLKELA